MLTSSIVSDNQVSRRRCIILHERKSMFMEECALDGVFDQEI